MSGQTEINWGEELDLVGANTLETWTETSIGEICASVKSGGTPLSTVKEYYENGQIPWLKTKEIKNARIYGAENYITELGLRNSSASLIPANSISVAMYGDGGTAGRVGLTKVPLTTNQACCNLTVDERKADYEFVFYKLLGSYDELVGMKTGSGQQNLSASLVKNFRFNLPPLLEQRAIASILSSLDDKIDLLHRQNATLEALAETLFRQWFVEEAKEEWEEVTVGDYVRMNDESISKGYRYSIIEYLDTGSITAGKIDAFQTLNLEEAPSRARRLVKHNDILISTVRPDQKHYGIIKNPLSNLVVSTGFCVLSCQDINPHFIYCLLTTGEMIEFMHSIAEGSTSTYPSLKPSDITKIEFRLPPKEMMDSFAAYADNAWEKIENNYIQIRTLSTLRDTLLPKLMSGEVRVAY